MNYVVVINRSGTQYRVPTPHFRPRYRSFGFSPLIGAPGIDSRCIGIAVARVTRPSRLTPHSLATAAAAVPVVSSGMDRNGELDDLVAPSPWRRLLRNRSAEPALLERAASRRRANDFRCHLDLIECEIPYGYADVMRGLVGTSARGGGGAGGGGRESRGIGGGDGDERYWAGRVAGNHVD